MTGFRTGAVAPARRFPTIAGPIRLDLLTNPYGPTIQVQEAIAGSDDLHLPAGPRQCELRSRLAQVVGVPPEWLLLANGIDELLGMLTLHWRGRGPLILFPPADPADARRAAQHGIDVVALQRSPSFALDLDVETAAELPSRAAAFVASPNDPTGTLLGTQEAVRLTRACELVVIDERYAEYSGRTFVPLVREFDNLLVVQTFETWAGLAGFPFAYAVGPRRLIQALEAYGRPGGVAMGAVLAALATLDDLAYVRATVRRVREERSRLYRMLRKLNMIRPLPSWASFLLARVERGDAGCVARELARRGVQVHRPEQPGLSAFLRISAGRPDHTDALKQALVQIALDL